MALQVKVAISSTFKFKEILDIVNPAIKQGLTLAAIKIKGQAVLLADFTQGYQTGLLRNSLSYSIGGEIAGGNSASGQKATKNQMTPQSKEDNTVYIGTSLGYADFVERGTSKMSAQPYLRPAYDICKNDVEKLIKLAIKNNIGGK